MTDKKITLEQVEQFMSLLTHDWLPDHWTPENVPKMTAREAFTVVYYLQEFLRVLPDHYEQCAICSKVYDFEIDGFVIETTDEPSDWYDEIGITKEMITESGGADVCSRGCELNFWREKFPEWRATG